MRRAHKQIGAPKEGACAFCRLHHAHLSVKQMRNRECLKKNCWHLSPFPDHPYWVQREREKALKKERREAKRKEMMPDDLCPVQTPEAGS